MLRGKMKIRLYEYALFLALVLAAAPATATPLPPPPQVMQEKEADAFIEALKNTNWASLEGSCAAYPGNGPLLIHAKSRDKAQTQDEVDQSIAEERLEQYKVFYAFAAFFGNNYDKSEREQAVVCALRTFGLMMQEYKHNMPYYSDELNAIAAILITENVVPFLRKGLASPNSRIRSTSAIILQDTLPLHFRPLADSTVTALNQYPDDPSLTDHLARVAATLRHSGLEDQIDLGRAIPTLIKQLDTSQNEQVRISSARALGLARSPFYSSAMVEKRRRGEDEVTAALLKTLASQYPQTAQECADTYHRVGQMCDNPLVEASAEALGALEWPSDKVVNALLDLIRHDRELGVKFSPAGANALIALKARAAVPYLLSISQDVPTAVFQAVGGDDPQVRTVLSTRSQAADAVSSQAGATPSMPLPSASVHAGPAVPASSVPQPPVVPLPNPTPTAEVVHTNPAPEQAPPEAPDTAAPATPEAPKTP
jgi:HEAT repeat protein